MLLTRWDPFAELDRLTNVHRLFGEPPRLGFRPAVDIFEEDDGIVIKVEVPGMSREDVKVHVENNVLTLSGERRIEHEEEKRRYHRVERWHGSFRRAFVLPKNVDGDAIEASLDDGLLLLRLPKRASAEKREIAIVNTRAPKEEQEVVT